MAFFIPTKTAPAVSTIPVSQALNHGLERHALHPAIVTVVTLADELIRLERIAKKLSPAGESSGELKTLANELQISASIAQDKLSLLDIEKIAPVKNDHFDAR